MYSCDVYNTNRLSFNQALHPSKINYTEIDFTETFNNEKYMIGEKL